MDPLSDIVRVIKLHSALYLNGEFSAPWRLSSPEACHLAPLFARHGEHLIIYHLLCDGQAVVEVEGGRRVTMGPGDLVTFPHGHGHLLGSGSGLTDTIDARAVLPGVLSRGLEQISMGGGGTCSRFICGFLACDPDLSRRLLVGLPSMITINLRDDSSGQWLENSLKFAVAQAASKDAGAAAMLAKLSEVFFAEALRRYVRGLSADETGWFAGVRDADVGKALALLHGMPAHTWTVAELARQTGVSRTVLAQRFRHFLDEPPMAYLTRWRLQLGARALATTSHSVAQIASDVGYESEAAFNRAFKRQYHLPPARYRRQQA